MNEAYCYFDTNEWKYKKCEDSYTRLELCQECIKGLAENFRYEEPIILVKVDDKKKCHNAFMHKIFSELKK